METTPTIARILACLICASAFMPEVRAAELDIYGGFTDVKCEQTGFFHTQKIGNRWSPD